MINLRFRIFDTSTHRLVRNGDHKRFPFTLECDQDGVMQVQFADPNLVAFMSTGDKAEDGKEIFEGDIVDAIANGDLTTDVILLIEGVWKLGGYEGSYAEHQILRVVGCRYEMPWPLERE